MTLPRQSNYATKLSHKTATFYDGPSSSHSVASVGPENTNASKGSWGPTFYWNHKSTGPTFDAIMAHNLHYYPVANDNSKLRVVTAYRDTEADKQDLQYFGHTPYWDDKAEYFVPWLAGSPVLTTEQKNGSGGFVVIGPQEFREYKDPSMTNVDLPLRDMIIYGSIKINDFGKAVSAAAAAETLFGKYLLSERPNYVPGIGYVPFTDRSMEWKASLDSEGYTENRELKGIGSTHLIGKHLHGATVQRKFIALAANLESEAWKLAYAQGYRGAAAQHFVEEYVSNVIEHELAHLYEREGLPENTSEYNIRSMHGRMNAKRAALKQGTIKGSINEILSRHWHATARQFGGKGSLLSRLEAIADEALEEAEAMGLEGDEAVAYARDKVSEYSGNNDSNIGGSDAKEANSGENGLEGIISDSGGEDTRKNSPSKIYDTTKSGEAADNAEPANDNTPQTESKAA